jgi:hypothetical protein
MERACEDVTHMMLCGAHPPRRGVAWRTRACLVLRAMLANALSAFALLTVATLGNVSIGAMLRWAAGRPLAGLSSAVPAVVTTEAIAALTFSLFVVLLATLIVLYFVTSILGGLCAVRFLLLPLAHPVALACARACSPHGSPHGRCDATESIWPLAPYRAYEAV